MLRKAVESIVFILTLLWMTIPVYGVADADVAARVTKAASVVRANAIPSDKPIPNELLQRAAAIAVIPGAIKGGGDLGGAFGKGVLSERLADGRWTTPIFVQIGGGAWAPPSEGSSTDLVLVFTNADALRTLEEGTDLKLGVDASAAPGPVGPKVDVATDAKLGKAIYAYSHSTGMFVGVALNGATLEVDHNTIQQVYGSDMTARKVLLSETILANETVKPFIDALQQATAKKAVTD